MLSQIIHFPRPRQKIKKEKLKLKMEKLIKLSGNTLKEKVDNFLNVNKSVYAIENVNESFSIGHVTTDNYGLKQYTLKQYYKNIPVYDSELRFHFNKNDLKNILYAVIYLI